MAAALKAVKSGITPKHNWQSMLLLNMTVIDWSWSI